MKLIQQNYELSENQINVSKCKNVRMVQLIKITKNTRRLILTTNFYYTLTFIGSLYMWILDLIFSLLLY